MCTIAITSLCLFGCSTVVPAPYQISVDASYSGEGFGIAIDSPSLTVALPSNPSTGFEWELTEISDQTVLNQTDHQYVHPEDTGMVGVPGKEIWTFKALSEGNSTVTMEYSQLWVNGTKAAETFNMTVCVSGPAG